MWETKDGEEPSAATKARPTKLSRNRYVIMSCRFCGSSDHSKRTCPTKLAMKAREDSARARCKLNFYFKIYVINMSYYYGICLLGQNSGVNGIVRVNVDK